jgi:hypothetical protein
VSPDSDHAFQLLGIHTTASLWWFVRLHAAAYWGMQGRGKTMVRSILLFFVLSRSILLVVLSSIQCPIAFCLTLEPSPLSLPPNDISLMASGVSPNNLFTGGSGRIADFINHFIILGLVLVLVVVVVVVVFFFCGSVACFSSSFVCFASFSC